MIYRYRKFYLPISKIRIFDVAKSADLPISENHCELPISENRIIDIGKYVDLPISATKDNVELVSYFHEIYPPPSAEDSLRESVEESS